MPNLLMTNRLSKSLLRSHALNTNSCTISASVNVINVEPFRKSFCFIIYCYQFISSRITTLLLLCYPSTIKRTIRAIVIYSVDSKKFVISNKCIKTKSNKRILPSRTNNNSSATIIFISSIFWIITSLFYTLPYTIKSCSRQIMFGSNFFVKLLIKASTTSSNSINESITSNYRLFSAITQTFYHKLSLFISACDAFCDQAAKAIPDNISQFSFNHNNSLKSNYGVKSHYILCSHFCQGEI